MVRVIYRWEVLPENFDEFKAIWSKTTNRIHETVSGAKGSILLRSAEKASEVLTAAKWDWMHGKAFGEIRTQRKCKR